MKTLIKSQSGPHKNWEIICDIPENMPLWDHIENNPEVYFGLTPDHEYLVWNSRRTLYRIYSHQFGEVRTLKIFSKYNKFHTNEYIIYNGQVTRLKHRNSKAKYRKSVLVRDIEKILFD